MCDASCTLHCLFFFNDTAPTEIYTLSLHDALPISPRPATRRTRRCGRRCCPRCSAVGAHRWAPTAEQRGRSEEHTSELQSHLNLVSRLLLEKKKNNMPITVGTFQNHTLLSLIFYAQ